MIKLKLWFNKNVNVVKSVIPSTHHQDIVPILLGGFHCWDSDSTIKKGYIGLDENINEFINPSNKMWNNIDELNREFLLQ